MPHRHGLTTAELEELSRTGHEVRRSGCNGSMPRASGPYGRPLPIARDMSRNALDVARLADGIDGRLLRICRVC